LIAVDTNILVYAYRRDAPQHRAAARVVLRLAEDTDTWAVPWHCIHEFLAVVTNPRAFAGTMEAALLQTGEWLSAPSLTMLTEGPGYESVLSDLLVETRTVGGAIHDAHIAALCLYHGVSELWTADRDFDRFPRLRTRNPLTA
jgi:uncharacterized protein